MSASSGGLPPHLAVRGFDSLSVLHRDERVLVLRGTKLDTSEAVILKTRPAGLSGGAQTIAQEYELLKQLRASGATVEPLAFFCQDGLDVLVIKARPTETTQAGSEYLSTNGALDLKSFFPLAGAIFVSLVSLT